MARYLCLFNYEEEYNTFTDFGYPNVSFIKDKGLIIYTQSPESKTVIFSINGNEYEVPNGTTWEEFLETNIYNV